MVTVVAAGNPNGDGRRDIVVSCAQSKNLAIFIGGSGGALARYTHTSAGGWGSIAAADVNGDGRDNLITANEDDGTITVDLSQ